MALINLRNALMTGKRLPYDAEVEYLQATGNSSSTVKMWINTGIEALTTTAMEVTFQYTDTGFGYVMGQGWLSGGRFGLAGIRNNSRLWSLAYNNWHDFSISADTAIHTFKLDGATKTGSVDATTISFSDSYTSEGGTIGLFCRNCNGGTTQNWGCNGKLYSCKIWQNGTLVRDLIPVRKGTVGYMYDRVSGKLFGNAGTGVFSYGSDVVPVEYLQSSGTQWIDTGVVPAANDTYTVETRKLDARQDNASFGLASVVYCFANPTGTFWCHPALGAGGRNGTNPLGNTNWHTIVASPTSVSVDGVALGDRTSDAQSPLSTVKLFARGNNSASGGVAKKYNGIISHVLVNRGGSDLRKFYSVRVGTEGAMMDVLTRRIYRNAGTGAFTYGNDLKYPIPSE